MGIGKNKISLVDQEGGYVAIVNVEKINGNALLEIQTDDGAFESLLISKDDINNTVIKK